MLSPATTENRSEATFWCRHTLAQKIRNTLWHTHKKTTQSSGSHLMAQTCAWNMLSTQPLMCPRVHRANGRLGRSSALNLCQHLTKALCYIAHIHTHKYIRCCVYIHTESVTHTRSHPYMQSHTQTCCCCWEVIFRQLIDLRGFFCGLSSMAGLDMTTSMWCFVDYSCACDVNNSTGCFKEDSISPDTLCLSL